MEHSKIERINQLARKQREQGLTDEEKQEQALLRREYIDGFKANMQQVLDGVVIKRPDGTTETLKKKK